MTQEPNDNVAQDGESGEDTPEKVVILVVDDDPGMKRAVKTILVREGYDVLTASGAEEARAILAERMPAVVLLDIQMPGMSGLDLLSILKREHEALEVVMMTAYGTVQTAVRAVKDGAYDFLTKPFENIDQVVNVVCKAVEHRQLLQRNRFLEDQLEIRDRYEDLVGRSSRMHEVFELVESVAYSTTNILIQGESGTGKELVARAIHFRSPRSNQPFVAVNCSALTETLLESELFGHVQGAFTGATVNKKGLFEVAQNGTLFLDEIGDVPPSTQVKLLRALQEGEIKPVGATDIVKIDVRIIAATNKDLKRALKDGTFREDLFYRLNVIAVELPALRERVDDVVLLAHHFLQRFNQKLMKNVRSFSSDVVSVLNNYEWPGNVRELENVVERAVVLCRSDMVEIRDLPPHLREGAFAGNASADMDDFAGLPFNAAKKLAVQGFERNYLTRLLTRTYGNVSEASREAGLDRSNFRRIMKKYEIDFESFSG